MSGAERAAAHTYSGGAAHHFEPRRPSGGAPSGPPDVDGYDVLDLVRRTPATEAYLARHRAARTPVSFNAALVRAPSGWRISAVE